MKTTKPDKSESTRHRKTFPIRCIECGQVEVRPATIPYEVEKNQDGRRYKLFIPHLHVNRCDQCNEIYFNADSDSEISDALRSELGLLTPEQIRANLGALKLNQKEAAERLGVAPETMSRWLTGAMIQSRALDNLLRAFFGSAEVRERLSGVNSDREFGVNVVGDVVAPRS